MFPFRFSFSPLRRLALLFALSALSGSPLQARTWLVDFGPDNGTDGRVTPSGTPVINPGNGSTGIADANGNYWNNVVGAGAAGGPVAMSYLKLIDTSNVSTPIGLTLGPGWKSNGILNGGLLAPTAARLGNFAVATATEDYFFIDTPGLIATVNLNNLDPAKLYNIRLFGTRNVALVRRSDYTVVAGNGVFTGSLQTSGGSLGNGTGGADGDGLYDGNNRTIISLDGLQTDASRQLTLKVAIAEGGFAYLGVLEMTEAAAAAPIVKPVVRVDFGKADTTNGNPTTGPDSFGNYWNNFTDVANGAVVNNLVTTGNLPTALGVALTSTGWSSNGILNGGLLSPTAARLGELAVPTATQDYLFAQGANGVSTSLKITGLNPARLYSMRFFGTRDNAAARRSTYTIAAGNGTFAGSLQTSGTGIGDGTGGDDGSAAHAGNNRSTVALGGIQAPSTGEVNLQLTVAEGGFAYLGILEIIESIAAPPLPPVAISNGIDRWTSQDAGDPEVPGGVLFVGSSSIRRWETLLHDFADYRMVQRGFGGSQFPELNAIVHRIVTPYQPSAIVVWEGTNDIRVGGKTGEGVLADFQTFVNTVRAQLPGVPICYLGITPSPSFFTNPDHDPRRRTANTLIANYCASDTALKLHFIPVNQALDTLHDTDPAAWQTYWVDDTHLNRRGYALWLGIVRPALEAILPPNKTFTANPVTLAAGEKLFFDFGPSDMATGDPTITPDGNGNHWNNWHLTNGGGTINSGEHLANLVSSTGTNTGIRMTITGGFECNGKASFGGLFSPQAGLLGELAVETATEDFFFSGANDINDSLSDDMPGGFMLSGLNPSLIYEIRFFGARDNTETRITKYTVSGANRKEATLTTSGVGIGSMGGNNNDDEAATVSGVRPDEFGQVFVDLGVVQGTFAYLSAMEITASAPVKTISTWRTDFFTAAELGNASLESSLWGAAADPDKDGQSNLIEYALGTHPRAFNLSPVECNLQPAGDPAQLSLAYQKAIMASDLTYQVQASDTLENWVGISDVLVSEHNGFETRRASVPAAGFSRRWLRLRVTLGFPGA